MWLTAAALLTVSACADDPPIGPTTTAPQIACPADIAVSEIFGSSQPVTFNAPIVTGGAAPTTVTCAPPSGAAFPLGTTTVRCTAIDAQARQATCTFNVTLTGASTSVKKYDAFGDSLTEGENGRPPVATSILDVPNAYPTKLQLKLDETYPGQGVLVVNRGHSGDAVEKTLSEIPGFLLTDKPDAVLLLSGFNNLFNGGCLVSDGQGPRCATAMDAVYFGIRDCIRRTKESSVGVRYIFVSTLTPPGPLVQPTPDRRIRGDVIVTLNQRLRQVIVAEGAIVVDPHPLFLGHEAEYIDNDGLHLRPAGNEVLADTFLSAIKFTIR